MIKINVINEVNNREFAASFETMEEANAYLDKQKAKNSYGKPERLVKLQELVTEIPARAFNQGEYVLQEEERETVTTTDAEGNETSEEVVVQEEVRATLYTLPDDYVITITDLSQDSEYLNSKVIEKRKQEYPCIDEVIHVILDHGIDSPEYEALQEQRASVKQNNPKV